MVVLALICVISGSVWVNAYTKKAADEAAYEEIREVVHEPVTQTVAATVSLEATTVEATADNKQSSYTAPAGLAELMGIQSERDWMADHQRYQGRLSSVSE